jgi:signal transduction histidine kinase
MCRDLSGIPGSRLDMATERAASSSNGIPDDALLLLNRATLVAHSVRGTVHELNNIFQMISGSAELLSSVGVPAAATARVESILKQAERGRELLQAMGDLARRDRPTSEVSDVAVVADHVLQLRRYEHRRAAIGATLQRPATGPILARIDPQQLVQAILNLVVNAEQALSGTAKGVIQIALWTDGTRVEVTVADNGPGLDSRVRAAITPFVTTREASAAGLGLAATRLIALHAGGDLDIVGGSDGARLRLRLPAAARD